MSSSDPTTSVRPVSRVSSRGETSPDLWALVESVDAAVAACPPDERPEGAMLLRVVAEPGPGRPATGGPAGGPAVSGPAVSDPAAGDSATDDLAASDQAVSGPAAGAPATGDPTISGLATGDPAAGDPATDGRPAGDPATNGQTTTGPVSGGPATANPTTGEPATGDPACGASATGAAAELGVYPLDGDHPLDALLGFVAPPEWTALGVASTGLGHAIGHGPGHTARSDPSGPVHVTVLLARSGASAGVIRRGDRVTRLAEPPGGVVADACRRALGLPTAPAPASTAGLWTLSWLDRVLEAAAGGTGATRPLSWPDVAALHPAASHAATPQPPPDPPAPYGPADQPTSRCRSGLPGPCEPPNPPPDPATPPGPPAPPGPLAPSGRPTPPDPSGPPPDPAAPPDPSDPPDAAALARSTALLAQRWTWSRLRAAPATATVPGPRLTAAQAAWMDDGMFARWLLAWFPPLDDLLAACRDLLPQPIAVQVDHTVALTILDSEDTR